MQKDGERNRLFVLSGKEEVWYDKVREFWDERRVLL